MYEFGRIRRYMMSRSQARKASLRCSGLTLIELILVVALIAILATLAVGAFSAYQDRARNAVAMADIVTMTVEVERYRSNHEGALPQTLADFGRGAAVDPWKRPYYFTNLVGARGRGSARKDRRLNPLNSDYDLFSAGKDGVFKPQISQKDSLDDIIRARDGAFIDLAEKF